MSESSEFVGADGSLADQKFHFGDRVRLSGLSAENAKYNGKEGSVMAYAADRGRWQVSVDLPRRKKKVKADADAGVLASKNRSKLFWVSDDKLVLVAGGVQTAAVNAGADPRKFSTAALEARDPGLAGFFEFIKTGDCQSTRRVLDHICARGCPRSEAADGIIDGAGMTAIFGAIENGHSELVELLVEYGADCGRPYMGGTPMGAQFDGRPIHIAVTTYNGDGGRMLRALVSGKADPNDLSRHFGTPLMRASQGSLTDPGCAVELFTLLLELGARPRGVVNMGAEGDRRETTLLHNLMQQPDVAVRNALFKLAIEAGADPGCYAANPLGTSTPFLCAVSRFDTDLVRTMLKYDAGRKAIDLPDRSSSDSVNSGDTPLHYALTRAFDEGPQAREMALLLLEYGANPRVPDAEGRTAEQWLSARISKKRGLLLDALKRAEQAGPCHYCKLLIVRCNPKVCSACRSVYYCSARCQKKSWKAGHKTECKKLRVAGAVT